MTTTFTQTDRAKAGRLAADALHCLFLANVGSEVAKNDPGNAELKAIATDVEALVKKVTSGQQFAIDLIRRMGDEDLRIALTAPGVDNQGAFDRLVVRAEGEGGLQSFFESRLQKLASVVVASSDPPLQSDDACLLALAAAALSSPGGPLTMAAAAAAVAHHCG